MQQSGAETTEPETHLIVRVDPGEGKQAVEWELTCGPSGGTHPAPEAACAALAHADDPFSPVPEDQICTQIYGGPQTATIDGVWRGQRVHATYSRADGCQIHRWESIKPVLQPNKQSQK